MLINVLTFHALMVFSGSPLVLSASLIVIFHPDELPPAENDFIIAGSRGPDRGRGIKHNAKTHGSSQLFRRSDAQPSSPHEFSTSTPAKPRREAIFGKVPAWPQPAWLPWRDRPLPEGHRESGDIKCAAQPACLAMSSAGVCAGQGERRFGFQNAVAIACADRCGGFRRRADGVSCYEQN